MEKFIYGIMIACGVVTAPIIISATWTLTAEKTFTITIFDMIAVLITILQNPIVLIAIIIIFICQSILDKITK